MEFHKDVLKLSEKDLKKYLSKLDYGDLEKLQEYYDDFYYNDEAIVSDEKYDLIKDELLSRNIKAKEKVGAKLREGENRVNLPFWLGSMDKVKGDEEDKLKRWLNNNPSKEYFISEKLDGVSCLYHYSPPDQKVYLYTRGDGKVGADISHLSQYLGVPKKLNDDIYIRGELIMSKNNFKKYSEKFANPRNMVSGLINSKTGREGLNDIDFITYEIVGEGKMEKPSEQFKKLKKYGFKTATHKSGIKKIDTEILTELLLSLKKESPYELDGIIIQTDKDYTRNKSGNPDYAFAFKVNLAENIIETRVKGVEWNLSKRGVLKPRVSLEPVALQGVIIKYATGKNAKFIKDNGIGPGAIVRITRSNEVIPDIVSVVKAVEPEFPEDEWMWNETGVDILPVEINEEEFCLKIMIDFFKIFDIKNVSEETIKKFQENGYNSVLKILKAKESDFAKLPRFGESLAKKIYKNIHEGLKNISLAKLMAASSLFGHGIGVKKIESLLEELPNLLAIKKSDLMDKILSVKGFSEKTAKKIIDNLPSFLVFMSQIQEFVTFKVDKIKDKINLRVVFTGFRNKGLEDQIKEKGGEILSAVSGKTTHLVVKDKNEKTTKIDKAKSLGIPILTEDEFVDIMKKF